MGRQKPVKSRDVHPPVPPGFIEKLGVSDGICLIAVTCTLASCLVNFQVSRLSDDGFTNKEYSELVTGTMEVAICGPYIVVKSHEFMPKWTPAMLAPLKSWITCGPNVQIFRDTVILVLIAYVILVDISLSFVWLAIFPVIALVFIRALHLKFNRRTGGSSRKVNQGSSLVVVETKMTTMEVGIIVVMTLGALLGMDQLPDHAAARFTISQFLLFLSCTVAALTRMVMKLPAGASPGIALATEMLHKTLLLLLLATAHTAAAEWLGEDAVLLCLPEVIPVLLWFSLHLDRKPGSSSIISVNKLKPYRNRLIFLGAMVVAPPFAYLANSMDEVGLSGWSTTFQVSCGVSGILTYYLVFMLSHWPKKQVADAGKDGGASGMLKLWAYALLIAAAASLLLKCLVSARLGLQLPLHETVMYVSNVLGFNYSN
ncbi:hypothetical protein CFC21_081033 [Triticum aestivum]|uniref:Uncharacterized protein n=2 Tax=Triticum aestivum TaxID=4565 RepID=A0A3B6N2P5_WHEAT|nr:uncharacterized protein LOC123126202 [Triticum aestivum]XP_044402516.1 uncharacterized protein LOC123126202 [Triticum aestivum]XP_044402517.1 uncharacterized protein LOC123126202 [Triticum aestivum]KAF7076374.1 hypothetical protein CFC21_081033 [Triticum aestivum]